MSLIELMVAIVIGAILLAGLASVFFNSSRAQRELEKTGQLIENGRYAIGLLTEDLRHAGYYGQFYGVDPAPAALPDPCKTTTLDTDTIHMSQPIQGYNAPDTTSRPDISATTCGGLLTDDNLSVGSDILVIRRADTATVATMVKGNHYLQANSLDMKMYIGNNNSTPVCNNAISGTCKFPNTPGNTTAADTRQYHVHVYFVAPCSIGSGADGICTNTDPRQPTLKQLSLSTDGTNPTIVITPLVEGIEYFQVEYGIDDSPSAVDLVTGQPGDGVPDDTYTGAPTAAQWANAVSARVYLLARSPRATDDFTDTKQYQLAETTYGPFNDNFKRRVYSTEVRPVNVAGRREIP